MQKMVKKQTISIFLLISDIHQLNKELWYIEYLIDIALASQYFLTMKHNQQI